jgi:ferritin
MNKQIEALKLALSTLNEVRQETFHAEKKVWEAIYTIKKVLAQPKEREWVGLTDEEIQECLKGLPTQTIGVYARRIEAKLKEKNT